MGKGTSSSAATTPAKATACSGSDGDAGGRGSGSGGGGRCKGEGKGEGEGSSFWLYVVAILVAITASTITFSAVVGGGPFDPVAKTLESATRTTTTSPKTTLAKSGKKANSKKKAVKAPVPKPGSAGLLPPPMGAAANIDAPAAASSTPADTASSSSSGSGGGGVSGSSGDSAAAATAAGSHIVRVFTEAELAECRGANGAPLYLAILGEVFDVKAGERFYGSEGGSEYAYFAGRDGSRAFVSGVFEEKQGVVAWNVIGMTNDELAGIDHWLQFYRNETQYPFVGVLHMEDSEDGKVSGYYDNRGKPNANHARLMAVLEASRAHKAALEAERAKYSGCNSHWKAEVGGELWCPDGQGLPRQGALLEGAPSRCACYPPEVAAANPEKLKVPAGCGPEDVRCKTPP
eukprot:UC1_evm1s251